ncbi:MAG: MBOAT family protein [Planctomycetota bacterium]|nr:MBOAT family protein [Planctomycetota bacterium]
MQFSSPTFLFLFLPLALALGLALPRALRNVALFVASLVFYAWGEPWVVRVMLVSILVNWALALWVERDRERSRLAIGVALVFNLGLLGFYKYWNFLWDNLAAVGVSLERFPAEPVQLPIGISFFTFQALSYVIDVRRGEGRAQRNPLDFGLYIALFPQLIAGPIVRYRDVAAQIAERTLSSEKFASGVRRFAVGLAKKLLIANTCAVAAKDIFGLDPAQLDAGTAWLGALCYTAQIYFDFSGYSDMAIGLGRMLGFEFLENFDYPYIARSVTEFWRRWHLSLSTWFRDYLYIPLGGNRHGRARTYFNLVLVFFLCGLWHGAAWNFVVWGLFHGAFLVLERMASGGKRARSSWLGWPYAFVVAVVGWVFFNAKSLPHALEFLRAMAGFGTGDGVAVHAGLYLDALLATTLAVAAVGSTPWVPALARWRERRRAAGAEDGLERGLELATVALPLVMLCLSAARLSAGTFNPFIYFRF